MSKKTNGRKRLKIFIAVLLFLLVAVFAVFWYLDSIKEKIIKKKIIAAVSEKSNGLYSATIEKLKFSQVGHSISITNMVIVYDSVKYAELVRDHNAPSMLMKITFPRIVVSGLKSRLTQLKDKLLAKKLQIIDPTIEIQNTLEKKDSLHQTEPKELYKQILGDMDFIHFDDAIVSHANIRSKDNRDGKEDLLVTDMNVNLVDVQVDSLSSIDSTRFLFSKNIAFANESVSWFSSTRLYHYIFKELSFNARDNDIIIGHMKIEPQLSESAYATAMHFQSDRFDVELGGIKMENVNTRHLLKEEMWADALEVNTASVKIYRDIGLPRDKSKKPAYGLSDQLMKVPLPFMFMNARFPKVFLNYRERNDISREVGDVRFVNSGFVISNLTNMPASLLKDNLCRIDAQTSLMNMVPAKVSLVLTMGSADGKFFIEGATGSGLELVRLNDITIPMGMARVRSGQMHSIHFKLNGNNYRTDGTLTGLYNNLKLDFMEIGDDNKMNKKHFGSLVANLIIKDDNPKEKEGIRVAEIHHTRDMSRSFYNLVWKSVLEGINKTLGIKKPMKKP